MIILFDNPELYRCDKCKAYASIEKTCGFIVLVCKKCGHKQLIEECVGDFA
jgi:hypothetical protein